MSRENHAAADIRLAVRTEGPHVLFYVARLSTMEGAREIARFDNEVLSGDPALAEALIGLYTLWLQEQIRLQTGKTFKMVSGEPPEPRPGRA